MEEINAFLNDEQSLIDLSEFFKVFGDASRIKLLFALINNEKSVGTLAESLNMSQSAISHQLKTLKIARLVKFRREGKNIYYSLCDGHIRDILGKGMEHIKE